MTAKQNPSALSFEEQRIKAHDAALRLLAARERSAAELRVRLRAKGFSAEPVEAVLERLTEVGLQDDRRFAESFATDAGAMRGLSARRIQTELLGKGIERELAAAAATVHPDEEEARARALAVRKARGLGGLPAEAKARRILGFLARRGYPAELCRRLAAELSADPGGESVAAGWDAAGDAGVLDPPSGRDVP